MLYLRAGVRLLRDAGAVLGVDGLLEFERVNVLFALCWGILVYDCNELTPQRAIYTQSLCGVTRVSGRKGRLRQAQRLCHGLPLEDTPGGAALSQALLKQ